MPVGTVVAVTEHIAGSELAQAPAIGALWPSESLWPSIEADPVDPDTTGLFPSGTTTLDIVDPDEFDQDGGYATLVDADGVAETIAYAFSDDDTLLLASVPSGTYVQGDMVYLTDSVGMRIVERWCDVIEQEGEEFLCCRIPHNLYPLLSEGIRSPDNGEQVQFAEDGTDLVVTDVLGKFPVQDLNSVLVTTSPDGSDPQTWMDENGLSLSMDSSAGVLAETIKWFSSTVSTDDPLSFIKPFFGLSSRNIAQHFVFDNSLADFSGIQHRAPDAGSPNSSYDVFAFAGPESARILDGSGASDFVLADGSNTAWASWTPTFTGWSSNPSGGVYRYMQIGKTVQAIIRQPNTGTSNATSKTISLPITAATITNMTWAAPCQVVDSGTTQTSPGQAVISSGGSTVSFFKNYALGAWTASGSASIVTCHLIYEAA